MIPKITIHLIIGVLCGPFVLSIIGPTLSDVKTLAPVSQICLSFICFAAGAELYLPTLRPLLTRILGSIGAITAVLFTSTLLATLAATSPTSSPPLLPPSILSQALPCRVSISALAASISFSFSPASSLAVVREVKARGPATSTMLGIVMLADVGVLLAFALSKAFAEGYCVPGESVELRGDELGVAIALIFASIAVGGMIGAGLIGVLRWRAQGTPLLVLGLGALIFLGSTALEGFTYYSSAYEVSFEPLLVCITAGCVAINGSGNWDVFAHGLEEYGPSVFLPFFTLAGLSLDLSTLATTAGYAFSFFFLRAVGLVVAMVGVAVAFNSSIRTAALVAASLVTQAGVSLGLAGEVGRIFPGWGKAAETAIIGVVLVGQALGPLLCAWALQVSGEAGKGAVEGGEGEGPDVTGGVGGSSVLVIDGGEDGFGGGTPRWVAATLAATLGPGCVLTLQVDSSSMVVPEYTKRVGGMEEVLAQTTELRARLGKVMAEREGVGGGGVKAASASAGERGKKGGSKPLAVLQRVFGYIHWALFAPIPRASDANAPTPFATAYIAGFPTDAASYCVLEVLLRANTASTLTHVAIAVGRGTQWGGVMKALGAGAGVAVTLMVEGESEGLLATHVLLRGEGALAVGGSGVLGGDSSPIPPSPPTSPRVGGGGYAWDGSSLTSSSSAPPSGIVAFTERVRMGVPGSPGGGQGSPVMKRAGSSLGTGSGGSPPSAVVVVSPLGKLFR